jgi:hypothetical protein
MKNVLWYKEHTQVCHLVLLNSQSEGLNSVHNFVAIDQPSLQASLEMQAVLDKD